MPLYQLESIDLAFQLTVVPGPAQGRFHGGTIALNPSGKPGPVRVVPSLARAEPLGELSILALRDHRDKLLSQLLAQCDGRGLVDLLPPQRFQFIEFLRGFHQEPDQFPSTRQVARIERLLSQRRRDLFVEQGW